MSNQDIQSPDFSTTPDAWKELALLALSAVSDHAVHCRLRDAEAFRRQIHETIEQLRPQAGGTPVLIAAGSVTEAIQRYNAHTQRHVDALRSDVKTIMDILIGHLEQLHSEPDNQTALATLKEVVGSAIESANLSKVRDDLAGPLSTLRAQTESKRTSNLDLISTLQDRMTSLAQTASAPQPSSNNAPAAPPPPVADPTVDPCTQLPVRAQAESRIRTAIETKISGGLAVFYIHRMALTNARLGSAIGNQVILFCSQHVATRVTTLPDDLLFRWSGPAFVALLKPRKSDGDLRSHVLREICAPISRFFETPARSVYLPIKMTAEVIPLHNATYPEILDRIEDYIFRISGAATAD